MRCNPQLRKFKNVALGRTAYVLGNAPSLSTLNIKKLMGLDSFWVNQAFEMEKSQLSFRPKYYFVSDPLSIAAYGPQILTVQAEVKFLRSDTFKAAGRPANAFSVPFHRKPCMDEGYFSEDPSGGLYRGFTVVLDCIQMAYYMGYARVFVGGVDLTSGYFYSEKADEATLPVSRCIKAFSVAGAMFASHGRQLAKITASPNLPLDYLPDEEINVR